MEPNTTNTKTLPDKIAISSDGKQPSGISTGPFSNLGAKVENVNGYDRLRFEMKPGSSLVTNQETMSYMDGGLETGAGVGSGGIFGALLRGVTGSSALQNTVFNKTQTTLKIVLSPLLQGSIVQVNLKAGEKWRFADRSFLACTPNITVSGNINLFNNFRLAFAGEGLTYTTVVADKGSDGVVWVTAHGACEFHELSMGTGSSIPLYINNGCFLGMLETSEGINYWNDYVSVGTPNSMFSAFFTQLGFVMKVQDSKFPTRPARCLVLTQSLNPHNLEHYVKRIAERAAESVMANRMGGGGHRTRKTRKVLRR